MILLKPTIVVKAPPPLDWPNRHIYDIGALIWREFEEIGGACLFESKLGSLRNSGVEIITRNKWNDEHC